MNQETFVVDTNVLLSDGNVFKKLNDKTVIVPFVVLEELDKHKTTPGDVGLNARVAIRYLEDSMQYGNLGSPEGVTTPDGVTIMIKSVERLANERPDDTIIRTAGILAAHNPNLKILSNDAHLRLKAHMFDIKAVKHNKDLFTKDDQSYLGLETLVVSAQIINDVYAQGFIEADFLKHLPINSFLLLKSEENEKHTGVVKITASGRAEKMPVNKEMFGIKAKNLEQSCAVNLLLDKNVPLVTLVGKAGSGKTLLALAAGLELVMTKSVYKKIIIIKPPIPMGKDVGFLPGDLFEKMIAWAGPVIDSLEVLLSNKSGKTTYEHLLETEVIEVMPPTFIRGRSLSDAFILVDEAQSLTLHEVKTLVTRVGENSKIVLTGDVHQIDNPKVSAEDNGLSELIEAFKPYDLAGHITLNKCERSGLSSLAATIL